MSFMQPKVWQASYYIIETSEGTEFVDASLVGGRNATVEDLYEFLSGEVDEDNDDYYADDVDEGGDQARFPRELTPKEGWLAQMSAPGYMDQTDICAFATEQEALDYLLDTYGTQDDSNEEDWEEGVRERLTELNAE